MSAPLTASDRLWLNLKEGEEAVRVEKHGSILVPDNATFTAVLDPFLNDAQNHPEGEWGCNMTTKGKLEDTLSAVFNRLYLWIIPDSADAVVGEAAVNPSLLAIKRLMSGFILKPFVVDLKYPSIHSWLVPAGGGPVGTLGDTASSAALDTGGWMSNGVQSPAVFKDFSLRVPAGYSFGIEMKPRATGIVVPNCPSGFWVFLSVEGPGRRVMPKGAPSGGASS